MHLSSSPNFEGPRLGQPLRDELKHALAAADAVILVFTSDTEDWSYCMWECGVATNPNDPRPTSVVVVQCTADEPKVFKDQLRVDARNLDSVQGFVKAVLTTTDIFARRKKPITGFVAEGSEVRDFAADLHLQLAGVLPSGGGAEQSTPTSPYLRIRLDDQATKELKTSYLDPERDQSLELLKSRAEIAESTGAETLFGMVAPALPTATLAHLGVVEFDVYMVPFAPRPIPVTEKMITVDQMYFKDAAEQSLDEILLMPLVKDMNVHDVSRLPILDGGHPKSIIHKATINEFIVQAIETGVGTVSELTLHDLLAQHADALEGSYAEVCARRHDRRGCGGDGSEARLPRRLHHAERSGRGLAPQRDVHPRLRSTRREASGT